MAVEKAAPAATANAGAAAAAGRTVLVTGGAGYIGSHAVLLAGVLACSVAYFALLLASSPFRFFESIRVSGERNRNRHRKPNSLILGTETENQKPNRPKIRSIRFGSGSVSVFRF